MIDCEKILEIADRELAGTDLFTVSCKCSPMNEVELLIDSDTHVTIERCAELFGTRDLHGQGSAYQGLFQERRYA